MTTTEAAPGVTTIGWVGTGLMGRSMCQHVLDAGYDVVVTSRTRSRAEPLVEAGARWASTPAEVAAQADVAFSVVGTPADVRDVTLGPAGLLEGGRPGLIAVDMTTSEPSLAVTLAEEARQRGMCALDAPVSGGDVGARAGTLSIMAGGDTAAFETVLPCLRTMGSTIVHQGGPGAGQHTKAANQTLIAGTMLGLTEALLYAVRAGLDPDLVLQSVSTGAASSWSLSNLAPRILGGDFAPGFRVDHYVKDLGIALSEANRMGLATPALALAQQLYVATEASGRRDEGTHTLVHAVAALSGTTWPDARHGTAGPE